MKSTAQWLNEFLGYAYIASVFHRTNGKHRASDGYWGNSPVARYVKTEPVFDDPQQYKTFFWSEGVKYYAHLICGRCGLSAKAHPHIVQTSKGPRNICDRGNDGYWDLITWGDEPDYYLDGIAAVDYSGPGALVKDESNEDWSAEDLREALAIEEWRDTEPVVHQKYERDGVTYYRIVSGEHTSCISGWSATEQWDYTTAHSQFYASDLSFDADRNIVFEKVKDDEGTDELETGYDGFYTTLLIDPIVTEKYQHNLLNIFTSKRGSLMVGSMELSMTEPFEPGDLWVTATCVNPECQGSYITLPLDNTVTREYQEAFVWACIAHGNNHAIHFIKDKVRNPNRVPSWNATEFYRGEVIGYEEVTETKCATICDDVTCDHNYVFDKPLYKYHPLQFCSPETYRLAPKEDDYRVHYELPLWLSPKEEETDENFIATLFDHNSACVNPACSCESLLAEQVPALVTTAA